MVEYAYVCGEFDTHDIMEGCWRLTRTEWNSDEWDVWSTHMGASLKRLF